MRRLLPRWLACVLTCLSAQSAYAYRPFNSTDAAVAGQGEMELECGPVGYVVDADGRFLVVPSAIVNFGIAEDWELVFEGRQFFLLESDASHGYTLRDAVGLLLPGVGVDPGVGASFTGILSQRWSALTVHVNGSLEITHDHRLAGVAGAIVEGPSRWAVRPVAELILEQDAGRPVSGVVGGIWQVRHNLSLDAGWRIARAERASLREFRAGFTWAVPLWSDSQPRGAVPSSPQLRRNLRA